MSIPRLSGSAAPALRRLRSALADGTLDALCERHGVRLLVLFGSAAAGVQAPRDIDLGYLGTARTKPLLLLDDVVRLLGDEAVDLVRLDTAGPVATHRAMTGEGLYESEPGLFARARDLAIRQYFDTAHLRAAQAEVLAR